MDKRTRQRFERMWKDGVGLAANDASEFLGRKAGDISRIGQDNDSHKRSACQKAGEPVTPRKPGWPGQ